MDTDYDTPKSLVPGMLQNRVASWPDTQESHNPSSLCKFATVAGSSMVPGLNMSVTFVYPQALKNPFYFVSALFNWSASWFVALQRRKRFYTSCLNFPPMQTRIISHMYIASTCPFLAAFFQWRNPDSGFLELKNSTIPCLNKASRSPFSLQRSKKQEAPWLIQQGITGNFSIVMCSKIYFSDAASRNSLQLNKLSCEEICKGCRGHESKNFCL